MPEELSPSQLLSQQSQNIKTDPSQNVVPLKRYKVVILGGSGGLFVLLIFTPPFDYFMVNFQWV